MTKSLKELIEEFRNICIFCKGDKRKADFQPCKMCKPLPKYPLEAPDGQIFVCGACGRAQKSLLPASDIEWDESCMINAILCYEDSIIRNECGEVSSCKAVEGYQ